MKIRRADAGEFAGAHLRGIPKEHYRLIKLYIDKVAFVRSSDSVSKLLSRRDRIETVPIDQLLIPNASEQIRRLLANAPIGGLLDVCRDDIAEKHRPKKVRTLTAQETVSELSQMSWKKGEALPPAGEIAEPPKIEEHSSQGQQLLQELVLYQRSKPDKDD